MFTCFELSNFHTSHHHHSTCLRGWKSMRKNLRNCIFLHNLHNQNLQHESTFGESKGRGEVFEAHMWNILSTSNYTLHMIQWETSWQPLLGNNQCWLCSGVIIFRRYFGPKCDDQVMMDRFPGFKQNYLDTTMPSRVLVLIFLFSFCLILFDVRVYKELTSMRHFYEQSSFE